MPPESKTTNGNGNGHLREIVAQLRAWAQIIQVLAIPILLWMATSLSRLEQSQAVLVQEVKQQGRIQMDHEERLRELERK